MSSSTDLFWKGGMKMKATEQLKAEHDGIRIILNVLDRISADIKGGKGANREHLGQIVEFLKVFVDKCHHAKEEDVLFPALEAAGIPREGGPIGVMLSEHETGRGHVRSMAEALSADREGGRDALAGFSVAAMDYRNLLDQHIDKENNILYVMADDRITEEEQEKLFLEFEKIESDKIGAGTHERFHALIDDLEKIYLGRG